MAEKARPYEMGVPSAKGKAVSHRLSDSLLLCSRRSSGPEGAIKRLDDIRSPLRYLLGKTKLQKELDGLSFAPDIQPLNPGDIVLRGIPKTMRDRVSELLLEVTPEHQIVRILIREVDGTSTDFRFSQIEENVPVQDGLFHFTPPPGVEVLQDDKVAQ